MAIMDGSHADGIAVRRVGGLPLAIFNEYVDEIVTVNESEIANAILLLLEREKSLVEGAGAVGVAAGQEGSSASQHVCPSVRASPYLTLAYGEAWLDGRPASVGSVVEAVTPRGEVAGCFVVQHEGAFGVMPVYGADADGVTPGFREGEAIVWRVNGQAAAGLELAWADDKETHQVRLEAGGTGDWMIYLPAIIK